MILRDDEIRSVTKLYYSIYSSVYTLQPVVDPVPLDQYHSVYSL